MVQFRDFYRLPKPRYTPEELKEIVWNHGESSKNFPMRKIRGQEYYLPCKNPKGFLERNNLCLDEYRTGVRKVFIGNFT